MVVHSSRRPRQPNALLVNSCRSAPSLCLRCTSLSLVTPLSPSPLSPGRSTVCLFRQPRDGYSGFGNGNIGAEPSARARHYAHRLSLPCRACNVNGISAATAARRLELNGGGGGGCCTADPPELRHVGGSPLIAAMSGVQRQRHLCCDGGATAGVERWLGGGTCSAGNIGRRPAGADRLGEIKIRASMILTQVHLRKPCYDFYFL